MLKNVWVRVAIGIALVIVLYYLVVTLSRGVAEGAETAVLPAASEPVEGWG